MIELTLENEFPYPTMNEIESRLEKENIKIGNLIWSKLDLNAIIPRGEIIKDGKNVFYDFKSLLGIEEFLRKNKSKWKIPDAEDFMSLEKCLRNNPSFINSLNGEKLKQPSIWWSHPSYYNEYMNIIYVMRIDFDRNVVCHPEQASASHSYRIRLVKECAEIKA